MIYTVSLVDVKIAPMISKKIKYIWGNGYVCWKRQGIKKTGNFI